MKYWHKIWPYGLVLLLIIDLIETFVNGNLLTKLIILFSPLCLSWIGIKKLRNKDRADEISSDMKK